MRHHLRNERGFTLIELLVVVLIIGILATIAIPTMLAQRKDALDADAKSNARSAYGLVEACGVDNGGDYTTCTQSRMTSADAGLPWGSSAGQVAVSGPSSGGYTITAYSKTGRTFVMTKSPTGRTLTVGGTGSGTW